MSYQDIFNTSMDAVFQGRCLVATWNAAQDILTEPSNTVDHIIRFDWATRVLQDRTNITPRQLAIQVLRNPSIASSPATSSDSDIQFQVNSILPFIMLIG